MDIDNKKSIKSVKRELEDDFTSIDSQVVDTKLTSIKSSSCTSGDYDEWLEIQKELGVYPTTDSSTKCKNNLTSVVSKDKNILNKERTRPSNCEYRITNTSVSASVLNNNIKNIFETDNNMSIDIDKKWCTATDLERDLLEDTDSLDGLALNSQNQLLSSSSSTSLTLNDVNNTNADGIVNEHDDITAQVQSAIDSILNLKQRPTVAGAVTGGNGGTSVNNTTNPTTSQTSDNKDSVLDQAVRSILGS